MDTVLPTNLADAVKTLLRSSPEDDAPTLHSKLLHAFPDVTKKQVKNAAQRIRKSENLGPARTSSNHEAPVHSDAIVSISDFKITSIPGKGMGVIAARPFQRGDLIIAEQPIISLSASQRGQLERTSYGFLEDQFRQLSKTDQDRVMALHDCHAGDEEKTLYGIYTTNAFQAGGYARSNLYVAVSRFNCSCAPNASAVWREQEGRHAVYATCSIDEGEELCISYMGSRHARKELRQKMLFDRYGYLCKCSACEHATPVSDAARDRMGILEEYVQGTNKAREPVMPEKFMEIIEELFLLYKQEDILTPTTLGRLADEATETCAILSRPRLTTRKWAMLCFENYLIAYGPEDASTKKAQKWMEDCKEQGKYNRFLRQVMQQQGIAIE